MCSRVYIYLKSLSKDEAFFLPIYPYLAFPRTPPYHRYIALAHIAYGGLGGHTCESCSEAVGKRAVSRFSFNVSQV